MLTAIIFSSFKTFSTFHFPPPSDFWTTASNRKKVCSSWTPKAKPADVEESAYSTMSYTHQNYALLVSIIVASNANLSHRKSLTTIIERTNKCRIGSSIMRSHTEQFGKERAFVVVNTGDGHFVFVKFNCERVLWAWWSIGIVFHPEAARCSSRIVLALKEQVEKNPARNATYREEWEGKALYLSSSRERECSQIEIRWITLNSILICRFKVSLWLDLDLYLTTRIR